MTRLLFADEDARRGAEHERVGRAAGHEALRARSRDQLLELVRTRRPEVCFLDGLFPGLFEDLPRLLADPRAPTCVVLTGEGEEDAGAQALRLGASEWVAKPLKPETLALVLERTRRQRALLAELDHLRGAQVAAADELAIGDSPARRRLREGIQRIAGTHDTTVLITGERGVGKTRAALAIHARSRRAAGAFVRVDCARPEPHLEEELFGEGPRSALTLAEEGTLVLEEVAGLTLRLQARLASHLEERARHTRHARVVGTTRHALEELVARGRFREDLLYRLNVLTLAVPPLRERRADLRELARHYLRRHGGQANQVLGETALRGLEAYPWPGNDDELRCVVERAALTASEPDVGAAPQAPAGDRPPLEDCSLRAMEEALIRHVLAREGGNRSRVARVLGINRTTLYNKLKLFGIDPPAA